MIKAILIDVDGILNNGDRFSARYAKTYGVDISILTPFFDGPFKQCLVGEADLKEELRKVSRVWKFEGDIDELVYDFWFSGEININQGILKVLKKIRKKGIPLFIATNQEKYRAQFLWENMKFNRYFEKIFASGYLGVSKADPQFFAKVLEEIRYKPEEVMYWDDREKNIHAAKTLGIKGYLFTNIGNFIETLSEDKVF